MYNKNLFLFFVSCSFSLAAKVELSGEVLYLQKGGSQSKQLAYYGNFETTPHPTALNANKLSSGFGYEFAYRAKLLLGSKETGVILSALYSDLYDAKKTRARAASISFPFLDNDYAPDYYHADKVKANYKSRLFTSEAYVYNDLTPFWKDYYAFRVFYGFQYVYMPENINLAFIKGQETNIYNSRAYNNLGYFNLGFRLQVHPYEKVAFEFFGSGGIGGNFISSRTRLGYNNNQKVKRSSHTYAFGRAFNLEGGISFIYKIASFIELSLGYEVLYLNGLCYPYEQMSYKANYKADRHIHDLADGYYQGGTCGIKFVF